MQFLINYHVNLIFEVKYPFYHSENRFNLQTSLWYTIPLSQPISTPHGRPGPQCIGSHKHRYPYAAQDVLCSVPPFLISCVVTCRLTGLRVGYHTKLYCWPMLCPVQTFLLSLSVQVKFRTRIIILNHKPLWTIQSLSSLIICISINPSVYVGHPMLSL